MNRNDDAINFDTQNFIGWGKNLLVWSTTKKNQKNIAHYNIYETIWMKLIQHDDDLCTEFGDLLDDERRWMWQHTRASDLNSFPPLSNQINMNETRIELICKKKI